MEPDLLEQDFERFYHNVMPYLTPEHAEKLLIRLKNLELLTQPVEGVVYGADYDLKSEVENLITAARALKNSVMYANGDIKPGITPREMKEVVTSTSSLISLLMKSHEQLMNFDRQRILEQSTVEVLREMGGEEIVSRFVKMMEERLEAV
jgi:hypothetical protein